MAENLDYTALSDLHKRIVQVAAQDKEIFAHSDDKTALVNAGWLEVFLEHGRRFYRITPAGRVASVRATEAAHGTPPADDDYSDNDRETLRQDFERQIYRDTYEHDMLDGDDTPAPVDDESGFTREEYYASELAMMEEALDEMPHDARTIDDLPTQPSHGTTGMVYAAAATRCAKCWGSGTVPDTNHPTAPMTCPFCDGTGVYPPPDDAAEAADMPPPPAEDYDHEDEAWRYEIYDELGAKPTPVADCTGDDVLLLYTDNEWHKGQIDRLTQELTDARAQANANWVLLTRTQDELREARAENERLTRERDEALQLALRWDGLWIDMDIAEHVDPLDVKRGNLLHDETARQADSASKREGSEV